MPGLFTERLAPSGPAPSKVQRPGKVCFVVSRSSRSSRRRRRAGCGATYRHKLANMANGPPRRGYEGVQTDRPNAFILTRICRWWGGTWGALSDRPTRTSGPAICGRNLAGGAATRAKGGGRNQGHPVPGCLFFVWGDVRRARENSMPKSLSGRALEEGRPAATTKVHRVPRRRPTTDLGTRRHTGTKEFVGVAGEAGARVERKAKL